ncbi:MAG: hypothetical protein BA863_01290 [Desulfovibrio sp. S3730MH75]|nr:MAG: hypothetical protein BA863_01290 [Desulfovibrio sp. S3730MH75]
MIIAVFLILVAAIATVFFCKSITTSFDKKNNELIEKEHNLTVTQKELAKKRRDLKKKLNRIKKSAQKGTQLEQNPATATPKNNLKSWISSKQNLDDSQYDTAENFAKDKNMSLLSAMLTLDIISVEIYEKAKKIKFGK